MQTIERIEYKGYTVNVHIDESPENPFTAWGSEPPLATYYGAHYHGDFVAYGDFPGFHDALGYIKPEQWARGERVKLVKGLLPEGWTLRNFVEECRDMGCSHKSTLGNILTDAYGETPSNWGEAYEWFGVMEAICKRAGVACYNGQSNGYSQGNTSLVLVIATPAWVDLVGAPAESLPAQCEAAFDLYGAWAWGDVYGYTLEDGGGNELDHMGASVWGFYGYDHEKSGLMEAARNAIDSHIEDLKNQQTELEAAFSFHA